MANTTIKNNALLAAALEGLELQKARIEEQIREVRSMLGQKVKSAPVAATPAASDDTEAGSTGKKRRKRRKLSAEARARIAAAQKKRWTEYRKKKGEG